MANQAAALASLPNGATLVAWHATQFGNEKPQVGDEFPLIWEGVRVNLVVVVVRVVHQEDIAQIIAASPGSSFIFVTCIDEAHRLVVVAQEVGHEEPPGPAVPV